MILDVVGLPDGEWTIERERLPNGVARFVLKRAGAPVLSASTYSGLGSAAYVEHEELVEMECGDGYVKDELLPRDELEAQAAFFTVLGLDMDERDESTSVDILVGLGSNSRAYAFECDTRCRVGDVVEVFVRSRWREVEVLELGTGDFDGKRAPAKLVRSSVADVEH